MDRFKTLKGKCRKVAVSENLQDSKLPALRIPSCLIDACLASKGSSEVLLGFLA